MVFGMAVWSILLGQKMICSLFFDIIDNHCDIKDKDLVIKELKIRYIRYKDVYLLDSVFKK